LAYKNKAPRPNISTDDASHNGDKTLTAIANVVPSQLENHKTKTICRPDQTPWWKTFGEGVALLGGLGLLFVNFFQMKATQNAADAAATAANTAQKQLEMSERPWVVAQFFIDQPIQLQPNGDIGVRLRVVMKNIGHSVATDVRLLLGADPEGRGAWFMNTPKEQKEMCDNWRNIHFPGNPGAGTKILFPNDTFIEEESFTIAKKQIEKVQAEVSGKRVITGISLFGCVNYGFAFTPEHHQTGFNYDLIKPGLPPPPHPLKYNEVTGGVEYMNVGETIPASQLKIRQSIFGGFYVD